MSEQAPAPEGGAPAPEGHVEPKAPGHDEFTQKVLKEKKNAMEALREKEARIKELETAELKRKEDFTGLIKNLEEENLKLSDQLSQKDMAIQSNVKKSAVKAELQKLGIDQKYLDDTVRLVDLKNVVYDEDTAICTGQDLEAKKLMEKFPPLFQSKGPGVNQAAPEGRPGVELTFEEWRKLPSDERAKRKAEMYANHGIKRT